MNINKRLVKCPSGCKDQGRGPPSKATSMIAPNGIAASCSGCTAFKGK